MMKQVKQLAQVQALLIHFTRTPAHTSTDRNLKKDPPNGGHFGDLPTKRKRK